jgi:hypothetical protein
MKIQRVTVRVFKEVLESGDSQHPQKKVLYGGGASVNALFKQKNHRLRRLF